MRIRKIPSEIHSFRPLPVIIGKCLIVFAEIKAVRQMTVNIDRFKMLPEKHTIAASLTA